MRYFNVGASIHAFKARYLVVESKGNCNGCGFFKDSLCSMSDLKMFKFLCKASDRRDGKDVIFRLLPPKAVRTLADGVAELKKLLCVDSSSASHCDFGLSPIQDKVTFLISAKEKKRNEVIDALYAWFLNNDIEGYIVNIDYDSGVNYHIVTLEQ